MEAIIEACKGLDMSWLPNHIGPFRLVIDQTVDEGENLYRIFHYENDLGWRWEAHYNKEVQDYTVRVKMPLFEFTEISFIRDNVDEYWDTMKSRCSQEVTKLLVQPEENFDLAYRTTGLLDWDFSEALPEQVGSFVLDIDPHHGIRMINGSYIIGEYRQLDDPSGLLLFYNVLRNEFFAELRIHNYPEIDHHLDANSVQGLEAALKEHLCPVLEDLHSRL